MVNRDGIGLNIIMNTTVGDQITRYILEGVKATGLCKCINNIETRLLFFFNDYCTLSKMTP